MISTTVAGVALLLRMPVKCSLSFPVTLRTLRVLELQIEEVLQTLIVGAETAMEILNVHHEIKRRANYELVAISTSVFDTFDEWPFLSFRYIIQATLIARYM